MLLSSRMVGEDQARSETTPGITPVNFSLVAGVAHRAHEETQLPSLWVSGPTTVTPSRNARCKPTNASSQGAACLLRSALSHRFSRPLSPPSPEEARPGVTRLTFHGYTEA